MLISTVEIIEALENESLAYGISSSAAWTSEHEKRLQITANTLRRFRDTLISIANCRNGIASHQAQAVLIETGECAHFNATYTYDGDSKELCGWKCRDCGKESAERIGAFE